MTHAQKVVTTLWTTLLAAPTIYLSAIYAGPSCGELDPCRTGGPMPYAWVAIALLVAVGASQVAFLIMLWRSNLEEGRAHTRADVRLHSKRT